jgi:hypothetical protein
MLRVDDAGCGIYPNIAYASGGFRAPGELQAG